MRRSETELHSLDFHFEEFDKKSPTCSFLSQVQPGDAK